MHCRAKLRVPDLLVVLVVLSFLTAHAATPIKIDAANLVVTIDATACRWSAEVKGTPMRLNEVHFLPDDDSSGWSVASSINQDDTSSLGSFVTVTLRGTKPGQLDFGYQVSISKAGNDILVSLDRSNNTGKAVEIGDMDYFVSSDARLGGATDKWISLGTMTRNRDYYDLNSVVHLITPQMYTVNHVVRDTASGNSLLMGHVTAWKGSSRFEVGQGWQGKIPDRMQVRGYCSYKVTMPQIGRASCRE